MVSVIQKLSPHFSLAKWILCSTGLTRYLHPTDDELRKLSGVPREKGKGKKDKRNGHQANGERSSTFHIPRSLDIRLDTLPISPYDIVHLRFYTEYQWLVDFSLYSAIVYTVSEVTARKSSFFLTVQLIMSMIFFFLGLSFLLSTEGRSQFEHALVPSGCVFRIVSFSTTIIQYLF